MACSHIQQTQNTPKLFSMSRLNPARSPRSIKSLKPFMPETNDQYIIVSLYDTFHKPHIPHSLPWNTTRIKRLSIYSAQPPARHQGRFIASTRRSNQVTYFPPHWPGSNARTVWVCHANEFRSVRAGHEGSDRAAGWRQWNDRTKPRTVWASAEKRWKKERRLA